MARHNKINWNDEQVLFVRDNFDKLNKSQIAKRLNSDYGMSVGYDNVRTLCRKMGLKKPRHFGTFGTEYSGVKTIQWTDEHLEFIKNNQANMSRKALLELMRDVFDDLDPDLNLTNFRAKINRMGLKNNPVPHNRAPLHSEQPKADGYVYVKTQMHPPKWRPKHVLVWEAQNGKVPKGHNIRFIDGNNRNFDIDNLICVTDAVQVVINTTSKADTDNPNLNKAIILTETLKYEIRKLHG